MNRAREILRCSYAYERGIYGTDIVIAVIDSGIAGHHPDLEHRVLYGYDFIQRREGIYDDCGHGSHIAGIIGGTGAASEGKYAGIAPKCRFVSLKVLDSRGNGNMEHVLQALDWVRKNKELYGIRMVNLSVGTVQKEGHREQQELLDAVDAVWDDGVLVCVAAGNEGPKKRSITVPGISRKVITVGSSDDNQYVEVLGSRKIHYSGRGPTAECVCKPDVVAPGSHIVSCGRGIVTAARQNQMYSRKSGTSMSTPMVVGALALLQECRPEWSNKQMKLYMKDHLYDLGLPRNQQGWGRMDVETLLKGVVA